MADRDTRTEAAARLTAIMRAMGCEVREDTGECPWCADGYCRGHGTFYYCTAHDWHEDGNSRGVCGYAATLLAAADADDRENGIVRVKLDDKLENRIRHAIQHGMFGVRMRRTDAESATTAVVTLLREAVQP